MTEDLKVLTRLAELQSYKAADKAILLPLLEKYRIEPPTSKTCRNCWRDVAVLAVVAARAYDTAGEVVALPRLRGRHGKNGVVFKGRFISNATMTEALAAWMAENGFPEQLYER